MRTDRTGTNTDQWSGATFPAPIYTKWFSEYHNVDSSVNINYQAVGSGSGINQVSSGTVDFGATDGPMSDKQIAEGKIKVLHFPTVLGAVVLTYNIPGVTTDLNFTPAAIAGIYLGKISKWDDPAIANANKGVKLPSESIIVVHRADASGTTYVFTDYLSAVSPEWKGGPGKGATVNWPGNALASKGNDGVTGLVKNQKFSIGYVELVYAVNKLPYAKVQNKDGNFVLADLKSVTEAAAGAAKAMPADFRVSIVDAPGKDAYPISTFTWLLIPSHFSDAAKGKAIVRLPTLGHHKGTRRSRVTGLCQLPAAVVTQGVEAAIGKIK